MFPRCVLARCVFVLTIPLAAGDVSISSGQPVASFHGDLQSTTPAPGWSYLWNANGAIGAPANYLPLTANPNGDYTTDGSSVRPAPAPGSYLAIGIGVGLGQAGGHPGMGALQDGPGGIERYCIAMYTLAHPDKISLLNGFLRNINPNNGGSTDGLNLKVFVNDSPIPLLSSGTAAGFDQIANFSVSIGDVAAGDRIYVAIGSRDSDFFDHFNLRFDIVSVPEPSAALLVVVGIGSLLAHRPTRTRSPCNRRGDYEIVT